MSEIRGRVLSLPLPTDIREEAARAGVDEDVLGAFATGFGAEMVKLSSVAPSTASMLQTMLALPAGLAVVYPGSEQRTANSEQRESEQASKRASEKSGNLPLPLGEGRGEGSPDAGSAGVSPASAAGDRPPALRDASGRGEARPQDSALRTQDASLHPSPFTLNTSLSSMLLAGSRPLLMDVATRLEGSGDPGQRAAGAELRLTLERYDGKHLGTTRCGNVTFEWGRRTYVMGIVNVTPNSFSGDGLNTNVDAAVEQALRFVEEGADILDVGGESTRPGFEPIGDEEEIARVVPVIKRLAGRVSVPISIDSYKVEVVRRALDAGGTIVNDIWGLRHDPALAKLAAQYDTPIVLMHNRRSITTRTELGGHVKAVEYSDLMGEMIEDLRWSIEVALQNGVKPEKIVVDPGIGFGKTPQHNIVVMRRQRELRSLGRPILMGTSRKSFIGLTLGLPVDDRVEGTGATVALSIVNGADIVRVHDVKQMVRISRMMDAMVRVESGE